MNKMIDYNATLQKFFDEIAKFLNKQRTRALDKIEMERIHRETLKLEQFRRFPKLYADYDNRVKNGLVPDVNAYLINGRDNSVYLLLERVLNIMGQLDSEFDWYRHKAQNSLLNALKTLSYKNATSIFKDFTYPFKSAQSFAVMAEQSKKR